MIYEVKMTGQAEIVLDLRGVYEYIASELQAPENAAGQVQRLEEQIISSETVAGTIRGDMKRNHGKVGDFVYYPVDNYVVLYIPDEDRKTVEILRVMYGGRNIDKQLNLYTKQ